MKTNGHTITIRGLDKELLIEARSSAIRKGKSIAKWLNEAISDKLYQESLNIHDLDSIAEDTGIDGIYKVPKGTVKVGEDYSIKGSRICAAGRRGNEEVVTYESPSTIHNQGYQIFWIR